MTKNVYFTSGILPIISSFFIYVLNLKLMLEYHSSDHFKHKERFFFFSILNTWLKVSILVESLNCKSDILLPSMTFEFIGDYEKFNILLIFKSLKAIEKLNFIFNQKLYVRY